jgi:hypothetical protein
MNTLPEDLVRLIADFTCINHILGLPYYLYFKKSCYYHTLNKKQSLKFYKVESFRKNMLDKIKYPRKQLSLDLNETKVSDVSALGQVHTLDLCGTDVSDVSALAHVHTLNLSETLVSDVSALGHVHTLNLSGTKVSDASALGHVHTLDLRGTKVTDTSMLKNVKIIR